jgi:hypothetical protein
VEGALKQAWRDSSWFQQPAPIPASEPDYEGALKPTKQSAAERRKVFNELGTAITKAKKDFRGNARHDVVKAAKHSNIYFNSVCILTGSQGSGKTFTALAESIIVCRANRNTHMLIFVKKKGFDPTAEFAKPLIEDTGCHFVEIGYEEAEDFVRAVFHYKQLYNKAKRAIAYQHAGRDLEEFDEDLEDAVEEEIARMFEILGVDDFHHDWLNTIIVFDDTGNSGLFRNPDSFFNNRLKLCRDDNAIYFLTVHGITQLSPSIKQNTATVFVFKGLSLERLSIIWRQLNIGLDWQEMKGVYWALGHTQGARYICVDNILGSEPNIE